MGELPMGIQKEVVQSTQTEGFSLDKYVDERIKGSVVLHEVSHVLVGVAEGATDITLTVDKHAGSTEMEVYTMALPNVYMSSFLDSKAPGTVDDFTQNIKVSGVDSTSDDAIKKAMHAGRIGALRSILRIGAERGVGGIELLNEVALLVQTEHQRMDKPLVLNRAEIDKRISQAVEIIKNKQLNGEYSTYPAIDEGSAGLLSDKDLDQRIADAKKSQVLIVTWPPVNKGERKTIMYLGEDVHRRKQETSLDCLCEGHGFHFEGCQWGKKENERQQNEKLQTM